MKTKVKKIPQKKRGATLSTVVNTYIQEEMDRQAHEIRERTRLLTMDMVVIALGRIGLRETKFRQFKDALDEVWTDYGELIIDVSKEDPDLWEAKAKLDREISLYVGNLFVPFDERYGYENKKLEGDMKNGNCKTE